MQQNVKSAQLLATFMVSIELSAKDDRNDLFLSFIGEIFTSSTMTGKSEYVHSRQGKIYIKKNKPKKLYELQTTIRINLCIFYRSSEEE